MTIKETKDMVIKLQELQGVGGKRYREVNKLLNSDATTHNIAEAVKFIKDSDG